MEYYVNPSAFSSAFSLPSSVTDRFIALASGNEIKVILWFFRHISDGFDKDKCASELKIPVCEVEDALIFWCNNGVILKNGEEVLNDNPVKTATPQNVKPSRQDVIKRGLEDSNFKLLLSEAQMKFGRNLKTNESQTLLYIYDDLGLDISVCLFLLQYALNEDKMNIRFIEKTAVEWHNSGVKSIIDAEKLITDKIRLNLAWKRTEKAFGIEERKPSAKESQYADLWFNEWELDDEILTIAYDVCVDSKSKFIFEYCAKTIANWHKEGLIKPDDVRANLEKHKISNAKKDQKYSYAGYDLVLYEKMLNSED